MISATAVDKSSYITQNLTYHTICRGEQLKSPVSSSRIHMTHLRIHLKSSFTLSPGEK